MIINQWLICYYIKGWNPQGFFGGFLPLIDVGTATVGGGFGSWDGVCEFEEVKIARNERKLTSEIHPFSTEP